MKEQAKQENREEALNSYLDDFNDEDTLDADAPLPKDGDVDVNNVYTDFYKNLFSDNKATTPKKGLGSDDYLRLAQIKQC